MHKIRRGALTEVEMTFSASGVILYPNLASESCCVKVLVRTFCLFTRRERKRFNLGGKKSATFAALGQVFSFGLRVHYRSSLTFWWARNTFECHRVQRTGDRRVIHRGPPAEPPTLSLLQIATHGAIIEMALPLQQMRKISAALSLWSTKK